MQHSGIWCSSSAFVVLLHFCDGSFVFWILYACQGCCEIVSLWILLYLQVRLGKNGVEEVLGLGPLSDFEKEGLEKLKPELKSSIEKGIKFATQ